MAPDRVARRRRATGCRDVRSTNGHHPLRVLYLDHTSLVSGAQRALMDLVAALPSTVSATVICPPGKLERELRDLGADLQLYRGTQGSLRFDPTQTPRALWDVCVSAWQVRRAAKAGQIDLIHANSIRAGIIALLAFPRGGPPTLVHVHDCLPGNLVSSAVRWLLCRRSQGLVAVSQYAEKAFVLPGSPVLSRVLYNPIDLDRFDPAHTATREQARVELGFDEDAQLVAVIAQITPWKGQRTLVEAFAQLRADLPRAQLLLVGEPKFISKATRYDNLTYQRELYELVAALGLEDTVHFLGERADVPRIMRAVDVLAMPSWEEPLGRTVMEAMAMEVPVVVTSVGGPAELVSNRREGLLVPPRRPAEWAQAIGEVLKDRETALAWGKAGRQRIARSFDRSVYVEDMIGLYREVVQSAPAQIGRDEPVREVTVLYVDHSSKVSGAQRSLLELLAALPPEVSAVVACPPGDLSTATLQCGVPVARIKGSDISFRLSPRSTPRALIDMARAAVALAGHLRRVKPDLVHANSLRAGLISMLAQPFGRRPVAIHIRDCLPDQRMSNLIRRVTGSYASMLISNSCYTDQNFSHPRSRAPRRVVHNSVDLARFDGETVVARGLREEVAAGPDDALIGVIAQITPWKGQDDAIRTLAELLQHGHRAHLVLVGEAKFVSPTTRFDNVAFERNLHELAIGLGVSDHVTFLGDRTDIPEILSAIDAILVPSWEEPFGRTVIEGMAMGRLVLATSVGGTSEIIEDGRTGFLLPPRSPSTWARALAEILADPERKAAIEARAAAEVRRRFTPDDHARQVTDIYRELIPASGHADR
jgi:glycosyltransferase involved in cell wall biosynthesis